MQKHCGIYFSVFIPPLISYSRAFLAGLLFVTPPLLYILFTYFVNTLYLKLCVSVLKLKNQRLNLSLKLVTVDSILRTRSAAIVQPSQPHSSTDNVIILYSSLFNFTTNYQRISPCLTMQNYLKSNYIYTIYHLHVPLLGMLLSGYLESRNMLYYSDSIYFIPTN